MIRGEQKEQLGLNRTGWFWAVPQSFYCDLQLSGVIVVATSQARHCPVLSILLMCTCENVYKQTLGQIITGNQGRTTSITCFFICVNSFTSYFFGQQKDWGIPNFATGYSNQNWDFLHYKSILRGWPSPQWVSPHHLVQVARRTHEGGQRDPRQIKRTKLYNDVKSSCPSLPRPISL